MTNYQIVITEPAENDLQSIINYISMELLSPLAAQALLTKITKNINDLQTLPKRFPLMNDFILAKRGIRKLTVDSYIIFYNVSEEKECVTIIRILYAKRNWKVFL